MSGVSFFVSENAENFTYETSYGLRFELPRNSIYSPAYNDGFIGNENVKTYINQALEKKLEKS